ncbi:RNA-binding cell elongation regulator Jag/EloR [Sporosarcina sp. G11-34]|uniref:RNA-binding cell elongation regulator Jag/EloR n=1 Tax=Sporosarcina sp. G11-34 TaxID=2849605 RepID=UPI0022A8F4FE|nr:RNA-binding cell elongation regulator Jag/EloR [Sporosarcina sp. G11-34]MCZ2259034.1 protein jag [Sporosarcina sp. G11-34]
MKKVTRKGANVEEAISAALKTLNVTRDQVEVEVIDKGKKGFLGFGAKDAEVTVTVIKVVESFPIKEKTMPAIAKETIEAEVLTDSEETTEVKTGGSAVLLEKVDLEKSQDKDAITETKQYLQKIAEEMGIKDLKVTHETDGKYVTFQLESSKAALLIGKRGQTLNALQQLSHLVANKYANQFKVVRIDVGDYRDRREQSLEQLANRMADKAVRTGQKVQLEPMPSYERKVIHHALSNRLDIETYSEGKDPYRYLTIERMR